MFLSPNILKGYCCFGFCYNTHTFYRLNWNTFTNEFAHSAHSFITIHNFSYTCVQNTYTFYTSLDTFQETPCKIHQKQSVFYIYSDFHIRYVTVGKKKVRVFMNSHHFYRWLIARVKIRDLADCSADIPDSYCQFGQQLYVQNVQRCALCVNLASS